MAKINRRDYLKQMGAASAVLGISNILSPSSSSAAVKAGERVVLQTPPKPRFLFTPTTPEPPTTANLTVLFGGLMGFSNTQSGKAQVGFQKGKGQHRLQITFYKITNGRCEKLQSFTAGQLARVTAIDLEVLGQPANVNYCHKADFERRPTDNPKDFGWVLDLEDFPLHSNKVTFTKRFSPILTLSQGTFYTHQLTNSKFNLVEESAHGALVQVINQVPRLVGAAIDTAGNDAVFKLNGTVAGPPLRYAANVRYEIQFMNDCFDGGQHCVWPHPGHSNEEIRNDFYLHYLLFTPNDGKKYGVSLNTPRPRGSLHMCPEYADRGSDEAPCMGAGFGGKTGF